MFQSQLVPVYVIAPGTGELAETDRHHLEQAAFDFAAKAELVRTDGGESTGKEAALQSSYRLLPNGLQQVLVQCVYMDLVVKEWI
jgi:hypothetical protein